eukprot:1869298-Rhodomonas_salina.4
MSGTDIGGVRLPGMLEGTHTGPPGGLRIVIPMRCPVLSQRIPFAYATADPELPYAAPICLRDGRYCAAA